MKRVLVIAAHPDDEILGVGGTVAMHVRRGDCVKLAVMCEGVSMRYGAARAPEVEAQARAAAAILGAQHLHLGSLPDQRVDSVPFTSVVADIENLIAGFEPDVLYGHYGGDLNRDHRILSEAMLVAARPYAAGLEEILLFETPSSTEWGAGAQFSNGFVPNVFVDISDVVEQKIRAFCCYTAEIRPEPHPRSPERLLGRAAYWGSIVDRSSAEAFALVRSIR